jgi:hypothetical protein
MPGDIKGKYGSNNQALIWTLASLAASATVGRECTAIDNSVSVFLDILFALWFETGTTAGNKQVLVYAAGSADGGTTYGAGTNALTGSDAAYTRDDPPAAASLVGPLVYGNCITSKVHKSSARSLGALFGGVLPDHISLSLYNDTGSAALSATAGNNKGYYQGVLSQYT